MNKKFKHLFLLISQCCIVFASTNTNAQNWEWAKIGVHSDDVEGCNVAVGVDDSGREGVYAALFNFHGNTELTFGTVTVYNPAAYLNTVFVKYDTAGTALWAYSFQGSCNPIGVTTDSHGNAYLFCTFSDSVSLGSTILYTDTSAYFIAKFSPAGSVIWMIKDGKGCIGGFEPILYYANNGGIKCDGADNIYVSSYFSSHITHIGTNTFRNADTIETTPDIFLAKYDTSGRLIWATTAGGTKGDYLRAFTVSPTGKVSIGGTFSSSSIAFGSHIIYDSSTTTQGVFLAMYDSSGTPTWAENICQNDYVDPSNYVSCLAADNSGNTYLTGTFSDTLHISSTQIGNPMPGQASLYLAKLDASHNVLWYKTACSPPGSTPGLGTIFSFGLDVDHCNNVWVEGSIGHGSPIPYVNVSGNIIDTAPKTNYLLPVFIPQDPGFIAGFNTAGGYICGKALQSGFDDENFIACGPDGAVYFVSEFIGGYLITGNDTQINTSNFEKFMVAKFKYDTIGCLPFKPDTSYTHIDTIVCAPSDAFSITLTTRAGTNYLWYDGTTSSTHLVYSSGVYWVSYMSGTNVIIDSFNVTFTYSSPPCPTDTTAITKVPESSPETLALYPNPVFDELTITIKIGSQAYGILTIANEVGQLMQQQQINSTLTKVDVSMLPAGLYFLTLRGTCGIVTTRFTKM